MDFFGLSKFKAAPSMKKPAVPILQEDNFAASIIGLEMEIEVGRFTIEDVQTLIKLYSRAVEYYVAAQSNYCVYFQNKIKQLLLRPNVMALIEDKSPKAEKQPEGINITLGKENPHSKQLTETEKEKKHMDATLKKQGMQLTKDLIVAQQDKDLNRLLKNYKVAEEVKNETFNKALQQQMAQLGRKVQKRRSLSRMRSLNVSKGRFNFDLKTTDISNIDKQASPKTASNNTNRKEEEREAESIIGSLFLEGEDFLERDKIPNQIAQNGFNE